MADVSSANIVGYAQTGLQQNSTMVTPQFVNIGTTVSNELQSLIPTGAGVAGTVSLQTLDQFGRTTATYRWMDGQELIVQQEEGYCWSDEDGLFKAPELFFGPGQGLWVYGVSASQAIQTSGQVSEEDAVVRLCQNNTSCGNPFPVPIDIQDTIVTGPGAAGFVNLQKLDQFGRTIATYKWMDGQELIVQQEEGYCWSDEDGLFKVTDVILQPGEGFVVYGTSNDQYLRIPAPEL